VFCLVRWVAVVVAPARFERATPALGERPQPQPRPLRGKETHSPSPQPGGELGGASSTLPSAGPPVAAGFSLTSPC
jgi:hypothetical protein